MSGKGTLKSFKTMLAEAKLPETTVPTCLRGDLAAQHEQLNAELEHLEEEAVDSLAGNGGAELAEQIRALEAEMREHTYPIKLRAMPRHVWLAFKAEYPPRLDSEGQVEQRDRIFAINSDEAFEPLVRRCMVDPELDDADFADFMGKLTYAQFDALAAAAWNVNKGDIDVPFSRAASRLNRRTADASKPPTD